MPLRYSPLRPTAYQLDRQRSGADLRALTYTGVGASVAGVHPHGYHWHSSELTVDSDWEEAKDAIRQWAGHRSAGGVLSPEIPPLIEGTTLAFGIRVVGVWATGTCRIVAVIDEAQRFGFSYGTLPHHPEQGEELFAVENNGDGTVTFRVAAFSRPAGLLTKMIGPIGRLIQRVMSRRYLAGFPRFSASASAATRR